MTNDDNMRLAHAIINSNKVLALSIINQNNYDPNYIYTADFFNKDSILIRAIDERLFEVALALLNNPKININYQNAKNNTAIFYAIKQKSNDIFDKLIDMKCDLSIVNYSGNTPLMAAIFMNKLDYMEKIVDLGNFNPGQENIVNETALLMLCRKYDNTPDLSEENEQMRNILKKIINTGESKPEKFDRKGNTALIYCCYKNIEDIAKLLIETGESNPNHINKNNENALMYCCLNNLINIIRILLDIPEVDPGHTDNNNNTALMISIYDNNNNIALLLLEKAKERCLPYNINIRSLTALFLAIDRKMTDVITELLKFDTDKIDLQMFNSNTSLLMAVKNKNKNEDIAIKILESGRADPYIKDEFYLSTFDYALKFNMNNLINKIKESDFTPKEKEIPLNKIVKDNYSQEDYKIGDWINESIDNIVFSLPGSEDAFVLEKRENLRENIKEKILCICFKDNGNQEKNNVNDKLYLYNGRSIGLFGFLLFTDINKIYNKKTPTEDGLNFTTKQLFYIEEMNCKKVESVVNHFYYINDLEIRRRGLIPPAGCTPGKGGKIYRIFPAQPDIYDYMSEKLEDINVSNKRNIENINEIVSSKPNLNVNLKVKENEIYNFEITNTTTIGELKEMFLEKIKDNGISQKPTIRLLMYLGENFSTDDKDGINVINIKNFQNGATFSPIMIGKQTGGRTQRKKYIKNKRLTLKLNKKSKK